MYATILNKTDGCCLTVRDNRDNLCRQLKRLAEIRRRAIRETEQYLNDSDNAVWPRSMSERFDTAA